MPFSNSQPHLKTPVTKVVPIPVEVMLCHSDLDMLILNEESSQPLKNLSSVIRYSLIHLNTIQRPNICGFNWKGSLTLNKAKFIEGKKISVEMLKSIA